MMSIYLYKKEESRAFGSTHHCNSNYQGGNLSNWQYTAFFLYIMMSTYLYKKEEPQDWGPTYHCNNN